jgi:hypothetical protein
MKKTTPGSKTAEPDLREGVLLPFRTPKANAAAAPAPAPAAPAGYKHIELEYPVHPRPRWLKYGQAGERLMAQLGSSLPAATALIEEIARFHDEFMAIPVEAPAAVSGLIERPLAMLRGKARPVVAEADPAGPSWVNGWFPAFDAVMLYGLLALRNPRWYVEIGSGNSTRFARRAIRDHDLRTKIVSIDPCPRAEIDAICDQVVRAPLEDVDTGEIVKLTSEDLLFLDSSHRSFQNSDVTVFFTEIVPALPPGIVYGMHDIYLPNDYPPEWAERFYSEQYLLASYLAGGAGGDEIVAPLAYLYHETELLSRFKRTFDALGLTQPQRYGNSFWLRKAAR